ncbi:MAG: nucleotidyltransferase family protein [Muribaculaceae bacterium]|nr:nucleotidyltransferase family protein [Muribaculaceae bacterium]
MKPYESPAEQAFFELVRCGMLDSEPDAALFAALGAEGWSAVSDMARRQTVSGICYSAFCRLPGGLLPPHELLTRWVARVNAIETANRRMSAALVRLVEVMRASGLSPIVQKGLSVSRFYPAPELRECGDIDLWLPAAQFARGVAVAAGFDPNLRRNPDSSVSFVCGGFIVELHKSLVNISRPRAARRLDAIIGRMCAAGTGHSPVPSPPPMLELLLIAVHIMRHAFGTGVGLRQICDYICACRALAGAYSPDEFAATCRELGISRWIAMLNRLSALYFGVPAEILPPSGLDGADAGAISPVPLMEIIRQGGNFGHHLPGRSDKKGLRHSKLHTAAMFVRRARFAASVAPAEAMWAFIRLAFGQIYC